MASEFPKWRTELPTEPGWYWVLPKDRDDDETAWIVDVVDRGGSLAVYHTGEKHSDPLESYIHHHYRWSGPLTPPPNEPAVVSMWQVVLRKTVELETPPGHVPEFAETIWEYTYDREPTIADIAECRTRCGMGDAAAEVYRVVDGGRIWDSTHVIANVCQTKE